MKSSAKPTIGWREWVALPELGIPRIKAKIDTGARTSTLHAFDTEIVRRRGADRVRFVIHPYQHDSSVSIVGESALVDMRPVRSSSGHRTVRPVIVTPVGLLGIEWPIELTLTNRDEMGFRMLLGRSAVRRRFLVDAGASFLAGRGPKPAPRGPRPRRASRKGKS